MLLPSLPIPITFLTLLPRNDVVVVSSILTLTRGAVPAQDRIEALDGALKDILDRSVPSRRVIIGGGRISTGGGGAAAECGRIRETMRVKRSFGGSEP